MTGYPTGNNGSGIEIIDLMLKIAHQVLKINLLEIAG